MLHLVVVLQSYALGLGQRGAARLRAHQRDAGQATAEYAIVVVGAALVGFLLITWATAGNGAGKIGHLLDKVVDRVSDNVG